ncbi:uncharacterized protein MKK02DRAFT_39199 [Dioszegia hungarica]|uniref:Uncharacterized protein n=1 Tax=Dioszegia hungarica TaxID=4972 RepID=A0AA38H641_9TREE|nr:uncharacterized protein MKK02DRAFT_39199 [Dioszegia hungarica]KAI9633219.1 hypothetical protein MKK02DRAFT_39199 [Dioszegia hungarica]
MDADPWADAPVASSSTSQPISKRTSLQAVGNLEPISLEPEQGDDFAGGFASASQSLEDPYASTADPLVSGGAEDNFGDDFDDFDAAPVAGPSSGGAAGANGDGEDAFGDFGDFEEGDFDAGEAETNQQEVPVPSVAPIPEERLPALSLHPFPSAPSLIAQFTSLLSPLLDPTSPLFTDEPPRLASSSRQILPTETARDAYIQLASPPQLKPLDWTRSRVRREHLIHMSIPVNLDEVDSHLLTRLPALTISTNFADLRAPRKRHSEEVQGVGVDGGKGKARETESMPVSAAPKDGAEGKYGLGVRPELDMQKAEELCGIEEDQISILSPAALAKIQADLVQSSAQASALLAHLLQLKDAQSHDAATYNGMISNLITNAANARSAQQAGSGGVFRRSSVRRPVSVMAGGANGSGSATPRTGSPALR